MADKAKVKFKNSVVIVGEIVDLDLKNETRKKKTNNEEYNVINGTISIQTDDKNIQNLRVWYMEKFNNGNINRNYTVALGWLNEMAAAEAKGEPNPVIGRRIQMGTNISPNVFISNGNTVKTYQISAGFIETNPQRIGSNKSEFAVDAVITKDLVPEVDRETEQETGRFFLEAEIADYRGMLFPVRFVIENPGGVKYLNNLPRPSVLEIWGDVVNTVITRTQTTENAFGEAHVQEINSTTRENIIKGASTETRDMDEFLEQAITEGRQAFNVSVAQAEDAAKNAGGNAFNAGATTSAAPKPTAKVGEFNF